MTTKANRIDTHTVIALVALIVLPALMRELVNAYTVIGGICH